MKILLVPLLLIACLAGTGAADAVVIVDGGSTVAITHTPEGRVNVGATVTETVTVTDLSGSRVPNTDVRIDRSGPGSGVDRAVVPTDANGVATYRFECAAPGTATVTATVHFAGDTASGSSPYDQSSTDSVACDGGDPPPPPQFHLRGHSHGADDVVDVLGGSPG